MSFFSNSKPELIGKSVVKELKKELTSENPSDDNNLLKSVSSIWNDFIYPNIFILAIFGAIFVFLLYKYIAKSENDEKNKINKINQQIKEQERISAEKEQEQLEEKEQLEKIKKLEQINDEQSQSEENFEEYLDKQFN